ncbi:MerC domain-containing protein [Croceicoccus hydrothermalis]|uniref:MerC domain-containing protein n=1 Tax=Croceicoccus hydrothermalis TaxID=2867964 RepID=UPI001EFAAB75|nr:MerC domain-containing protein [Croceicoccus hydrothermalis]
MERPRFPDWLNLDRFGIGLSGLCAVHCVASILLVGAVGIGGHALLSPDIHKFGLVVALIIGGATIGLAALRSGRRGPLYLGGVGIVLMAGAIAGPHGPIEAFLTIAGVALVAAAHVWNMRLHRCAI